jgi:hypothetical protein
MAEPLSTLESNHWKRKSRKSLRMFALSQSKIGTSLYCFSEKWTKKSFMDSVEPSPKLLQNASRSLFGLVDWVHSLISADQKSYGLALRRDLRN